MTDLNHRHESNAGRDGLEARIVQTLEQLRPDRDPAVRWRLDRARRKALDQGAHRQIRPLLVLGPALAAAVLVIATWWAPDRSLAPEAPPAGVELDLLTDPWVDIALEDPEFIAWLAAQDADALEDHSS
ncbi:MAG: hypothetical protein Kow0020_10060 [Wenzhouxiangellaceae bacterium]